MVNKVSLGGGEADLLQNENPLTGGISIVLSNILNDITVNFTGVSDYAWVKLIYKVNDTSKIVKFMANGIGQVSMVEEMYLLQNVSGTMELTPMTPAEYITFPSVGDNILYVKYTDVTQIPSYAFSGSIRLVDIVIPKSVKVIRNNAFELTGLKELYIPMSVTNVYENLFNGSTNLEYIEVDSRNTVYNSRNDCNAIMETATNTLILGCENTIIPDNCSSIAYKALASLANLSSVSLPSTLTEIDMYAFDDSGITGSLIIPNSVTNIGNGAFRKCKGLTEVIIGSGVQTIGNTAFKDCENLNKITSLATTAPTLGGTLVFSNVTKSGTLYYPTGADYSAWLSTSHAYLGYYSWNSDTFLNGSININTASNGVYAVAKNGFAVEADIADESCMGVALKFGEHQFLIAKEDATDDDGYYKFSYMKYFDDCYLNKYITADATNNNGYLSGSKTPLLSTDFSTWTAGALSDFDGKMNTDFIADLSTETKDMCKVLETFKESNGGGWYVPACGQLALIYLNMNDINTILTKIGGTAIKSGNYWSSTECSEDKGWFVNLSNGFVTTNPKLLENYVRFVRDIE